MKKELDTLTHAVRIYSQDIGMEFGMEKCAMRVMKSGKRHETDGMELPNHEKIRTLRENETYKYLGIWEVYTIKQLEMKDKIRKEYLRRTRNLLETKLNSRNLIKGINTWALPLVRYSGPILNKRICKIVDFAVPADHRLKLKECEKKDKYLNLSRELKNLWNMKVTIIPIVIGAFGTITKGLLKGLENLEVGGRVETIQTTALLRMARFLRRVLENWGDLLSLKLQWKTIS